MRIIPRILGFLPVALTLHLAAPFFVREAVASTAPSFGTPSTITTATPADVMVMGDFDGDGVPDVALLNKNTGNVEVHFGNGMGGFRSDVAVFAVSDPDNIYDMAAAELDGGGRSELIFPLEATVAIYKYGGNTFALTNTIDVNTPTGLFATGVAVGDLSFAPNLAVNPPTLGSRDIIVTGFGGVGLAGAWIPNDGTGNFGAPTAFSAPGQYPGVGKPTVADVKGPLGNGLADVVFIDTYFDPVAVDYATVVVVLLNNGDATLQTAVTYGNSSLAGYLPQAVTVADVDADGYPDIIATGYTGSSAKSNEAYYLSVNLNNGDGTFADGAAFPFLQNNSNDTVGAIVAADFNGDGRMDIATLLEAPYVFGSTAVLAGFTITRFTGTGASLAVEAQDAFSSGDTLVDYNSIAVGYFQSDGAFTTFNNDVLPSVLLGNSLTLSSKSKFLVFEHGSNGGGGGGPPPALPALASFGITGPSAPAASITFSVTTGSGLSVRVQATTTPTVEGSWTDLPNGGAMTPAADGTDYSLVSANYPLEDGISFRAIASETGYADSPPTVLGTYNLQPPFTLAELGPTSPGGNIAFTATTLSGYTVRLQSTTTPTDESSWTDIPYPAAGHFVETPTKSGNYLLNTSSYPGGSNISFRAIASKTGFGDFTSSPLGTFTLQQAVLSLVTSAAVSSTPTGKTLSTTVVHVGQDVTYRLEFTNSGTAPAQHMHLAATLPLYTDISTLNLLQYAAADVVQISTGGKYFAASSPGANDARIEWIDVGTAKAGDSYYVTFTIHLPANVQVGYDLTVDNGAQPLNQVFSNTFQPPLPGVDQAPLVLAVQDPIACTLALKSPAAGAPVAPGGMITYTLTLSNLGGLSEKESVVVLDQPAFTRFVSVAYAGKAGSPKAYNVPYQNGDQAQVLIDVPKLAPGASVAINVTFQAQWASPTTISTINYAAAFLNPAAPTMHVSGTETSGSTTITGLQTDGLVLGMIVTGANIPAGTLIAAVGADTVTLSAASTGSGAHSLAFSFNPATEILLLALAAVEDPLGLGTDFVALLAGGGLASAYSENDSGVVSVALQGSLANAPALGAAKWLAGNLSQTGDDGDGNDALLVKPGDDITFVIAVRNNGLSEADDVSVLDGIPDYSAYVTGSATIQDSSKGALPVSITPVLDPDGGHLHFNFPQLLPSDLMFISYTAQVGVGANAPPPGTYLNQAVAIDPVSGFPEPVTIGSASAPDTVAGFYQDLPILAISPVVIQVARPVIFTMAPKPEAVADVSGTISELNAFYAKYPNDIPLTDQKNPLSYLPGTERYYIHYVNNTGAPARGVTLTVPVPATCVFERAEFVALSPTQDPGGVGSVPGTIKTGVGNITAPPQGQTGTVTFTINELAVNEQGDVMVEVIVTSAAIQTTGSLVAGTTADLVTLTVPPPAPKPNLDEFGRSSRNRPPGATAPASSSAYITGALAFDHLFTTPTVPELAVLQALPAYAPAGSQIVVAYTLMNVGTVPAQAIEFAVPIPANTSFVSATYGQGTSIVTDDGNGGSIVNFFVSTNDGPRTGNLDPHTSATITLTLQVTGTSGSINLQDVSLNSTSAGRIVAFAQPIPIVDASTAPAATIASTIAGAPALIVNVDGTEVSIVNLDPTNVLGGNIVASGAGNIVASGAGNIVASGAGNIVASGAGNLITLGTGSGAVTGAFVVTNLNGLISDKLASELAGAGCAIVASGAGNIVASGAGNLVSTSGSKIDIKSLSEFVSSNGGAFASASVLGIVASGAGNVIGAGGANIVSTNGSNALPSAPDSTAMLIGNSGSTFSAGGGAYFSAAP